MTRYRRNAGMDESRRRAEREVAGLDTPAGQARVLTARMRAGELEPWHVACLSALGYEPAQLLDPLPANLLAFERGDWDLRLRAALGLSMGGVLIHDLEQQKQFLRVAGIGACELSERLIYQPFVEHHAHDVDGHSTLLPVEALQVFRSTVNTARYDASARVGVQQDINEPVRRLWDLRAVLNGPGAPGFGGEILGWHVGAVAALARLMTTLVRSSGIAEYAGLLFDSLGAIESAGVLVLGLSGEDTPAEAWTPGKVLRPFTRAVVATQDLVGAARDSDPPRHWSIRSDTQGTDYWSNEDGWTHAHDGDVFSTAEHARLNLPPGGRWTPGRPVTENDAVHALLRRASVDLLIPWLLTGPA